MPTEFVLRTTILRYLGECQVGHGQISMPSVLDRYSNLRCGFLALLSPTGTTRVFQTLFTETKGKLSTPLNTKVSTCSQHPFDLTVCARSFHNTHI